MSVRPATIFCDIDGTLVEHMQPCSAAKPSSKMRLLPGTIDKLREWDSKGYNIILTTGRRESMREQTKNQLSEAGIIYDQLIMGISGGKRYLINDLKPGGKLATAVAFSVVRNKGISDVKI